MLAVVVLLTACAPSGSVWVLTADIDSP